MRAYYEVLYLNGVFPRSLPSIVTVACRGSDSISSVPVIGLQCNACSLALLDLNSLNSAQHQFVAQHTFVVHLTILEGAVVGIALGLEKNESL